MVNQDETNYFKDKVEANFVNQGNGQFWDVGTTSPPPPQNKEDDDVREYGSGKPLREPVKKVST